MDAATKPCPYCAETIQAAAVVCRFCGRDLIKKTSSDDGQLMQQEIARLTAQGWQVVSQTETGAQLKKQKEWNKAGLLLFVALPLVGVIFFGAVFLYVAIFGLLIVVADYLFKKEQLRFLTAADLRAGAAVARARTEQPFVERLSNGGTVCSRCRQYVPATATECKHCKIALAPL
jgi:hypothetical protein